RHRSLADPIDQRLAVTPLADRVDDDALVKMSGDDHRPPIKEWFGFHRRPPQHLSGETRRAFRRIKLMPDGRMDSVGADQHVRFVDLFLSGLTIDEASLHAAILLKSGQL